MRSVLAVLAVVCVAGCGDDTNAPVDFGPPIIHDLSATVGTDMTMIPHDLSVAIDAGAVIDAACMHICGCFMAPTDQMSCAQLCSMDNARYGYPFSLPLSGSTSGTSAGSGIFIAPSSLSGTEPATPPAACLLCLTTATCSDLEAGTACAADCPYGS